MREYYLAIENNDYKNICSTLKKSLEKSKKEFVITANSEIFISAINNKVIEGILTNKNNTVVADGISIIKTAKYYGIEIKEKIPGVDLCRDLLDYCTLNKKKVYIYGAKEEVLEEFKQKYKDTIFAGLKNGYTNDANDVKQDIIEKKPDLVLCALGVPKQELVINDIVSQTKKGVFIGVGGSIDVLSGSKKRAPKFFINHNLEWLYRIFKEPKRFKRFWQNNLKLIRLAKKDSKKN